MVHERVSSTQLARQQQAGCPQDQHSRGARHPWGCGCLEPPQHLRLLLDPSALEDVSVRAHAPLLMTSSALQSVIAVCRRSPQGALSSLERSVNIVSAPPLGQRVQTVSWLRQLIATRAVATLSCVCLAATWELARWRPRLWPSATAVAGHPRRGNRMHPRYLLTVGDHWRLRRWPRLFTAVLVDIASWPTSQTRWARTWAHSPRARGCQITRLGSLGARRTPRQSGL